MTQQILDDAEHRMQVTCEVLNRELAGIRTGRASPTLIEELRIDYYGTPTPLKQLATITAPEPRLLVVQPYDRSATTAIERAILQTDLGLSPVADGQLLRIPIPHMTEERRKEMSRLVRSKSEDERVAIRNVRRDAMDHLRRLQRDKDISEDEEHRAADQLQKITDRYTGQVDEMGAAKEAAVMEV